MGRARYRKEALDEAFREISKPPARVYALGGIPGKKSMPGKKK